MKILEKTEGITFCRRILENLDVYKRQANLLGCIPEGDYASGSAQTTKAAWDALGTYLGCTGEEAARQTTVSYTHLDVYKRQGG